MPVRIERTGRSVNTKGRRGSCPSYFFSFEIDPVTLKRITINIVAGRQCINNDYVGKARQRRRKKDKEG
jgi:hypothetical protein